MGRAAKYSDQSILDAALTVITEEGVAAATVTAIAQRLGAPSGSIYHRFPSRDLLLATLWLRTVQEFQQGFLAALDDEEPLTAARAAVRHTLEWSAAHPSQAAVLALYRREDLIARWPDELGAELSGLNDAVGRAIRRFAAAHFGVADAETLGRARFALVQIPYAAVRDALRDPRRAPWIPDAVLAASLAVLTADGAAS
ncbi:TetR/AcrR family transcriptional regulator [Microbacterium sp. p3-SID336]|uniref:TetR/AcrR family transcriptional regulator n=1 Tax=Microbacterium sp. p3-SID336 TaxID=2916212 RepID=UPI0021A846ED|nr:TetR/AcrR family transcriptional regulator [Microbacterium sp. p3-SID336]MCT1478860.1 TetR/AcrR family transcriptional regulator [Microbacterium sp. p3-SID336]